ncbi:hypothetical protein SERLA73DRAFT_180398 [Serpula lacrymans var. lacrymans S7.3]|uniref:Uncharacterized protein n=2 Tax=Serpula lacrymans var. lacrymans TaxID=341189 RepID=F8PUI9_SERL3|nr:uncharacterized protein SERLADRAFT_465986 [Serpula lacrymans var. lacrymans S7.9]EGO00024.1 hypothetical protein SERLA73DRAFT_180398 [Serpula lacrymans var. lacrymans S7.3]EGO25597.1 hypothetical protein SERLADRAFT_465986 [Serpula lacrymans var. lacrymans S7.9]
MHSKSYLIWPTYSRCFPSTSFKTPQGPQILITLSTVYPALDSHLTNNFPVEFVRNNMDDTQEEEVAPRLDDGQRPLFSTSELSFDRRPTRPKAPVRKRRRAAPTTPAFTFSPSFNRVQTGLYHPPGQASGGTPLPPSENSYPEYPSLPTSSSRYSNDIFDNVATSAARRPYASSLGVEDHTSHEFPYPPDTHLNRSYPQPSNETSGPYFPTGYSDAQMQTASFNAGRLMSSFMPPSSSTPGVYVPTESRHAPYHVQADVNPPWLSQAGYTADYPYNTSSFPERDFSDPYQDA